MRGSTMENWVTRAVGAASLVMTDRPFVQALGLPGVWREQHLLMNLMQDYYLNTGLYDALAREAYKQQKWTASMKGLRNPCYRIAEFYVDHVWDGKLRDVLQFESGTGNAKRTLKQLWKWSNLDSKKDTAVRQLAIMGNQFIKIEESPAKDRVQLRFIDPRVVTSFEKDFRDYITLLRIDQEITNPDDDRKLAWWVEIWSKETQSVRTWIVKSADLPVWELGEPDNEIHFEEMGVDFVPFVHIQFKDIGEDWGIGAYTTMKDKIDEVNGAVTRLHQMVFRYGKAFLVLSGSGLDQAGQSLPPPEIGGKIVDNDPYGFQDDDIISAGGEVSVEMLVPNLAFDSLLNVATATLNEIEKDAPELDYYRLGEQSHVDSSIAARIILGAAIKRAMGCRLVLERSLIQADQMAMTIIKHRGLTPDGIDIGSFEKGDYEHDFVEREIIPFSKSEQAEIDQKQGQAATYWKEANIKAKSIAVRIGFKPSDVDTEAVDTAHKAAAEAAKPKPVVAPFGGPTAKASPSNTRKPGAKPKVIKPLVKTPAGRS